MQQTPPPFHVNKGDPILCVFAPMQVHPWWERMIVGCSSGKSRLEDLPLWKKLLLYKSYGQYRRANPRDSLYMAALADDFLKKENPGAEIDVLVHPSLAEILQPRFEKWVRQMRTGEKGSHLISKETKEQMRKRNYQLILLFYSDAIGYGWTKIERIFLHLRIPAVVAINGRRRVFLLNRSFRRKLLWSRFLESTWFPEMILVSILVPLSGILVIYDGIIQLGKKILAPNENRRT